MTMSFNDILYHNSAYSLRGELKEGVHMYDTPTYRKQEPSYEVVYDN